MNALVVDDHEDLRFILSKFLKTFGYNVQQASDGIEALEILESSGSAFSLLLTDFNMPKMTGLQLIQETIKRNISIDRIVVISGEIENQNLLSNFLPRGINVEFVSKPFSPEKLESILNLGI